jgi:hypothetical protein
VPVGTRNFSPHHGIHKPALWPTQPPIQWVPGFLSLGIKWSRHEADHSPPSSAEVKNEWSYTSSPQYAFMACCSVKKSTGTTLYLLYFNVLLLLS